MSFLTIRVFRRAALLAAFRPEARDLDLVTMRAQAHCRSGVEPEEVRARGAVRIMTASAIEDLVGPGRVH